MRKTETTLGDMMEENGDYIGLHDRRSHSDSIGRHDGAPQTTMGNNAEEKGDNIG